MKRKIKVKVVSTKVLPFPSAPDEILSQLAYDDPSFTAQSRMQFTCLF